MSSPALSATLQAAALSGLSNVLAQAMRARQLDKPFSLDPVSIARFVLFTLIMTPLNFYWQSFLEDKFPGTVADKNGQPRMSKLNVVKKFGCDQLIGAPVNNLAFIAGMNAMQGREASQVWRFVHQDFWPLMRSGLKVWPVVSVVSFTMIPARRRILFGSFIGLFWGIYLSLLAAH